MLTVLSRNLKPRKLILRAFSDFPRKLAPTKITRHTVCLADVQGSTVPLWLQDPAPTEWAVCNHRIVDLIISNFLWYSLQIKLAYAA